MLLCYIHPFIHTLQFSQTPRLIRQKHESIIDVSYKHLVVNKRLDQNESSEEEEVTDVHNITLLDSKTTD